MKKKYNIVFFILGLAIFVYLILNFGINNIVSNIYKTGFYILPIIGVWLVIYLLNTLTWYLIIKDDFPDIKYFNLLKIHLSSSALNYITPFINLGGEPYRIMCTREFIGEGNSITSTLLYNMLHMVSHIIFWLLCCFAVIIFFPFSKVLYVIIPAIIILLLFIFILNKGYSNGIFLYIINLTNNVKLFGFLKKFINKRESKLRLLDEQLKKLYTQRRKTFYFSLASEFAARMVAPFEFFLILKSLNMDSSLIQSFYIYGGSSLILNILFFIPMEAGVRESSLYWVYGALGLSSGIGIYSAVINRIREFFWILVGLGTMRFNKARVSKTQ